MTKILKLYEEGRAFHYSINNVIAKLGRYFLFLVLTFKRENMV